MIRDNIDYDWVDNTLCTSALAKFVTQCFVSTHTIHNILVYFAVIQIYNIDKY